MPDKVEIDNQFKSLGITVDEQILDLCESLCTKYQLSEEKLIESWIAWSFNKLSGEGPTKDRIKEWESKDLSLIKLTTTPKPKDRIKVYSSNKIDLPRPPLAKDKTPEGTTTCNLNASAFGKQNLIFSPASFSPDVYSPSMKYNSRENTRHSVINYGSASKWSSHNKAANVDVKEVTPMNVEWKYLHNTLREISLIMLDAAEELADCILLKNQLQAPTSFSPNVLNSSVFVGRVGFYDKTKPPVKVYLQGLFESTGESVELDLKEAEDYALFPGQVIAVEGTIISNKLLASKIFSSGMQPLPSPPKLSDTLQIVIAAGPFTLCDTLSYEPLHDLIQFVKENQPHLLFLIGPLIDANHPKVDGNIAESFYDYYQRMISNLVDLLKGVQTKLFLVASNKEAVSIPVYPTPPLCTTASLRNVKFYPDPSLLSVGGLVIGLAATDTIFHIGKHEISNSKSNRLGRLGAHMVQQQSFYPLYPSEPEVGLDEPLWHKCARMSITPHILVAPSNLNSFVKDIDGCLIVNPERLVKGMTGGTFACIEVRPASAEEEWTTSTHISAKIVKI